MGNQNVNSSKKINYIDFLKEIVDVNSNNDFYKITSYISSLPTKLEESEVKKHLEKCYENGNLGIVKERLNSILPAIDCWRNAVSTGDDKKPVEKANTFESNINIILNIVDSVIKEKSKPKEPNANIATYFVSYDGKIAELKEALGKLDEKIAAQSNILNDKLFSLILNTIAILGIFVAIAFAGFSAVSIFSELNIETTRNNLFANTFYIFLVSLLIYNLLFLLLYFIFRIVQKVSDTEKKFRCEMKWFLIIDSIIFALTVALFFCTLCLK